MNLNRNCNCNLIEISQAQSERNDLHRCSVKTKSMNRHSEDPFAIQKGRQPVRRWIAFEIEPLGL